MHLNINDFWIASAPPRFQCLLHNPYNHPYNHPTVWFFRVKSKLFFLFIFLIMSIFDYF